MIEPLSPIRLIRMNGDQHRQHTLV
jgi:hypothetical protein